MKHHRLLPLARYVLLWEKLWVALWPTLSVAGLFVALALLDVPRYLPPVLHLILLLAFVLGLALALHRAVHTLGERPDDAAAKRRLETDSELDHRPITAVEDQLATGRTDRMTRRLWEAHQQREAARINGLRLRWPSPKMANHDRWAIRGAVFMVLVLGLIVGRNDPWERIASAFDTRWDINAEVARDMLEVWVTPPGYTGKPPVYLNLAEGEATTVPGNGVVTVPSGSTVLARFVAGRMENRALSLTVGDQRKDMAGAKDGGFEADITAQSGRDIVVRDGAKELARWPAEVIVDTPPAVSFVEPPQGADQARLAFRYMVSDDYGLESLILDVELEDELELLLVDEPVESHRLAPPPGHVGKSIEGKGQVSFFSHPWSGLKAKVRLVAKDAAGQTTVAGPVSLTLPIREFHHQVAAQLVSLRNGLSADEVSRTEAADMLDTLSRSPGAFYHDTAAFLGMRIARRRLLNDSTPREVAVVRRLIWEIALQLEDGGLSQASREFQAAVDRLQKAIEQGASDEEMEKLIAEVEQALQEYMQKLAEMAREGRLAMTEMPPDARLMDPRQMQEMTQMLREMLRTGDKEAARQMLEALRSMMNNMQTQMGQSPLDSQQMRQAAEMMSNMQSLVQRQEELHRRTLEQQQKNQRDQAENGQRQPRPGEEWERREDMESLRAEQEQIRRQLGEMMRLLGEMQGGKIPEQFGQAEQSMRQAEKALGQGQPGDAMPPQASAIDALRQGMNQAMQQMTQGMMGFTMGRNPGQQGRRPMNSRNRDPLDRDPEAYDGMATGDIKIPDKGDIQKSRQILDELRRRAEERGRPPLELNYIERLLDLF